MNIEYDNSLKDKERQNYLKKMGTLLGFNELSGENFNVFYLKALRELVVKEQNNQDLVDDILATYNLCISYDNP
ncbi:MAG: hypothetical protein Q7R95_09255 [bacterium]|nr:hypothetical protein [bacterium]